MTTPELVAYFGLEPHPEGGYFKETYRSAESINEEYLPFRFKSSRSYSTAIYYLLSGNDFSAFHRIQSDELWHFYTGSALNLFVLHENGQFELIRLGSNMTNGEVYQAVVPAGSWFASQPSEPDGFSLLGCTVAPGFDFNDFELARRDELVAQYPEHAELISRYTRQ